MVVLLRDESAIELDQLANQLGEGLTINSRQGNTRRGLVQALHVLVGPEQTNLTLAIFVCLHTFEAFKGIVEYAS